MKCTALLALSLSFLCSLLATYQEGSWVYPAGGGSMRIFRDGSPREGLLRVKTLHIPKKDGSTGIIPRGIVFTGFGKTHQKHSKDHLAESQKANGQTCKCRRPSFPGVRSFSRGVKFVSKKRSVRSVIAEKAAITESSIPAMDDDDLIQKSLRRVMDEMSEKVIRNGSHYYENVTPADKLKLFFVSPSLDESERQKSSANYNIKSSEIVRETSNHVVNSVNERSAAITGIGGRSFAANATTNEHPLLSQSNYRMSSFAVSENDSNDTITITDNKTHPFKDKVEMKVELTINLSENDQSRKSDENLKSFEFLNARHGNESEGPGYGSVFDRVSAVAIANDVIDSGKNYINSSLINETKDEVSESFQTEERESTVHKRQGEDVAPEGASRRFDSASDSKRELNDVEGTSYDASSTFNLRLTGENSIEDDETAGKPETDDTYPVTPEDATTKRAPVNLRENLTISSSLKNEIENLIRRFLADNSVAGDTRQGYGKYLPESVGTPEEKRLLDQLRKYFSRELFRETTKFESATSSQNDFDSFIEILSKLKQSKSMQKSNFFPIISLYLNYAKALGRGSHSREDSNEEDDSWSSEYLYPSLLNYVYEYEDAPRATDVERRSNKAKGTSSEDEYDYELPDLETLWDNYAEDED